MPGFLNMKDREYNKQKDRVRKRIDDWLYLTGISQIWKVTVCYERLNDTDNRPNWMSTFRCDADWRYNQAAITAYLPTIENLDDEDLDNAIAHELMHILLQEMRTASKSHNDHEERVATSIAQVLMRMRNIGSVPDKM